MMRPKILIPLAAYNEQNPQKYGVHRTYIEAIMNAGGEPVLIARPEEAVLNEILSTIDGILLAGGADIDPSLYNEKRSGLTRDVDQDRDRVEITLARLAQEKNIPILGVCRGLQVMNVALGGTLYQDLASELNETLAHDMHKTRERNFLAHKVDIKSGSLLTQIYEKEKTMTNSLHHQGIKVLSDKLSVSGVTSDGLIEAVELRGHPFYVGVQWHPEELLDEPSVKLFQAFIVAAKNESAATKAF